MQAFVKVIGYIVNPATFIIKISLRSSVKRTSSGQEWSWLSNGFFSRNTVLKNSIWFM